MAENELDNIPRRMRRYYRKGEQPPESQRQLSPEEMKKMQEDVKKQSSQLAAREIRRFKEKFNRLPKTGEFDEIAENIYNETRNETAQAAKRPLPSQKKLEEELHGRFRHSKTIEEPEQKRQAVKQQVQEERPAEQQAIVRQEQAQKKEVSIAELLQGINVEEEPEKKKEGLSIDDLNLETDDLKKSLELLPEDEGSENLLKEVESDINTCPNCGSKTEHLIFCPNCGTAFCTHCAKAAKAMEDKISYTCPKCNAEFKARKTQ